MASGWLQRHVNDCLALASLATGIETEESGAMLTSATQVHQSMLSEHGVKLHEYHEHLLRIQHASRLEIVAKAPGYPTIDIEGLRQVLVSRQKSASLERAGSFPDPCGVILNVGGDAWVQSGDVLATVRDRDDRHSLAKSLETCISTTKTPSALASDETIRIIK